MKAADPLPDAPPSPEEMQRGHRVPAARVRSLPEALADPQLAARAVMQFAGPLPGGDVPHAVPMAPFGLPRGRSGAGPPWPAHRRTQRRGAARSGF